MYYLLPHRFKKIGAIIAPLGFATWLLMQFGYIKRLLVNVFGTPQSPSLYHAANVSVAVLSFFAFLAGFYFVTFSKELIEDEMVQRTRLDSFQFAALAQLVFIIISFLGMMLYKEPSEGGMLLFFIMALFLFWLCFIGRFNYILHYKINRLHKA